MEIAAHSLRLSTNKILTQYNTELSSSIKSSKNEGSKLVPEELLRCP